MADLVAAGPSGPTHTVAVLRSSPRANCYLKADQLEPLYPLRAYVCARCFPIHLEELESPPHIFSDCAHFASYSDSWVEHARFYTDMVIGRFGLGPSHQVIELTSNDGCLLQHFVAKGVPVLGIEPAANVAAEAILRGIPTRVDFFGEAMARWLTESGIRAGLLVGNNVLAQLPGLNDFIAGMALVLRGRGVITVEFPHLLKLIEGGEFDTIYREHFPYFSLIAVEKTFARHGLEITDFLDYTVDRGPHTQGRFLPGTRISRSILRIASGRRNRTETNSDHVVNLRDEITSQMVHTRSWPDRFVVPVPEATIVP